MTTVKQAERTHCLHGHAVTPESTRIDSRGYFVCLDCVRERDRARSHGATRRDNRPTAGNKPLFGQLSEYTTDMAKHPTPHRYLPIELPERLRGLRGVNAVRYVYYKFVSQRGGQAPTIILCHERNVCQFREVVIRVPNGDLETEIKSEILFWAR